MTEAERQGLSRPRAWPTCMIGRAAAQSAKQALANVLQVMRYVEFSEFLAIDPPCGFGRN